MIDEVEKHTRSSEREGDERRGNKRSGGRRRRRGSRRSEEPREPVSEQPRKTGPLPGDPLILAREQHNISRKNIDPDCLKVMRRLIRHGYKAFLVGGGVRDLLLERQPKDFDVSTDAQPEKVRSVFRNSRIIGRRFRMNHVYFKGNKIIEVSTFRRLSEEPESTEDEVQTLARDNTYGDPQTDAVRRDLTINGLFYDLETFSVIDYVGGIQDLKDSTIRVIGEPDVRFTEDPVRMIRAVRHAARIDFTIEPSTYDAICNLGESIELCPKARVYEEFQRELLGGSALASFRLMEKTGLLQYLFPCLMAVLRFEPEQAWARLEPRLRKLDEWFAEGAEISPAAAFASLLFDNLKAEDGGEQFSEYLAEHWRSVPSEPFEEEEGEGSSRRQPALVSKAKSRRKRTSPLMGVIHELFEPIGLPRKERERMEQLLVARYHMVSMEPSGSFARTLFRAPYFEEALKLLELTSGEKAAERALRAWKEAAEAPKRKPKKRKKRRRGGRRRRGRGQSDDGSS